jgi:hypothetical protein
MKYCEFKCCLSENSYYQVEIIVLSSDLNVFFNLLGPLNSALATNFCAFSGKIIPSIKDTFSICNKKLTG